MISIIIFLTSDVINIVTPPTPPFMASYLIICCNPIGESRDVRVHSREIGTSTLKATTDNTREHSIADQRTTRVTLKIKYVNVNNPKRISLRWIIQKDRLWMILPDRNQCHLRRRPHTLNYQAMYFDNWLHKYPNRRERHVPFTIALGTVPWSTGHPTRKWCKTYWWQ